jgi:hypothetical protein
MGIDLIASLPEFIDVLPDRCSGDIEPFTQLLSRNTLFLPQRFQN